MRPETWRKLEASPFWSAVYRRWRRLPEGMRAPLRAVLMPHWHLATWLVRARSHDSVMAGPFRGMKLQLSPLSSRHLLGYVLGTQERELHDVIERIGERGYGTILNIGAADGYYTVGLALRSPASRIEAFEALPEMHATIAASARLNGVADRITLRGRCTPGALRAALLDARKPVLVVMDIEGGEIDLLDPEVVQELGDADILVETHDAFAPLATDTLIDRFWQSHRVECYTAQPRVLDDFPPGFLPVLRRWFPGLAVDLMDERRTGVQHWLFLTAKEACAIDEIRDPAPLAARADLALHD